MCRRRERTYATGSGSHSHRTIGDELAVTVVSWNIATRHAPWRQLLQMDADVALLQEAALPPTNVMALRNATLPARRAWWPP